MFERSTSDARPDEPDTDTHRCIAGGRCRDAEKLDDGARKAAVTTHPDTLCGACTQMVTWAIDDITETWVALHMSIGDQSRRQSQKVGGSRTAPVNLNTDVDALKVSIVEWLTAAAARLADTMNIDDPHTRNNTDTEHARVVVACARIIGPHIDELLALGPDDVTTWPAAAETDRPGETWRDPAGQLRGLKVISMSGAELALKLADLRKTARSLLALTTPHDKLSLPCPHCNEFELVRSHRTINLANGKTKEIDQIDCGTCNLSWPYERYQQLCLIWVKEDEMEREKIQKKLDDEIKRRQLVEWLLAQLEWKLGLVHEFPDVRAADFVTIVFNRTDDDVYMTDKDIAIYLQIGESTVRSWATRGHITRHTADDGSTLFLAREVWDHYKASRQTIDEPQPANAAS